MKLYNRILGITLATFGMMLVSRASDPIFLFIVIAGFFSIWFGNTLILKK